MFLQQAGIPDNAAYLILGLVILFGLLGGWITSIVWRFRNLRQNMKLLHDMEADNQ